MVRAWLIEQGRTWLAVEFTKTRPEPPFDGDAALAAAVSELPRRAYGSGLDVRGSFIVRLSDLNAFLRRAHDDAAAVPHGPRLELVVVRDPDGGTDVTVLVDGVQLDDYDEYVIDAGRGYTFSDWTESREEAIASASPAAAALLARRMTIRPVTPTSTTLRRGGLLSTVRREHDESCCAGDENSGDRVGRGIRAPGDGAGSGGLRRR